MLGDLSVYRHSVRGRQSAVRDQQSGHSCDSIRQCLEPNKIQLCLLKDLTSSVVRALYAIFEKLMVGWEDCLMLGGD